MELKILTLLLVVHTTSCLKKDPTEVKNSKKAISPECKEISCPAVEDPVCMKLKNKHSNTTVFVRLLNKCEMGYMKCHKDMEGSTVPMKYCDHIHLITGSQNHTHSRRKRSFSDDIPKAAERKRKKRGRRPKSKSKSKKKALRASEEEAAKAPNNSDGGEPKGDEGDGEDASDEKQPPPVFVISSSERGATGAPGPEADDDIVELTEKDKNNNIEAGSENEDFQGENDYDDKFRADCPTACPSRVRLVCAKCDHGVYKTFLSACHVRMFNCGQDAEKMELVSRNSCIFSSPLVTTDEESKKISLEPNGKVYDRDDGDPVLAFIRCRNKNSLQVDEQGLEVIDANACKNIAQDMRKDKDYDNK